MKVIIANYIICKNCSDKCPGILNCLKACYEIVDLDSLEASNFALKGKCKE
jgi:hypothetical protein